MQPYDVVQIGTIGRKADADLAARFSLLPLIDRKLPENLAELAPQARVLVTSARVGMSREVIDRLPSLKAVASWGVGHDTLDLDAAAERDIRVATTPGVLDGCVADHAFALLMAVARQVPAADRHVKAGEWRVLGGFPETTRVSGKRMGILGMGRIGATIARRGIGFDMEIGYHNRRPRPDVPGTFFAGLTELAQWADFLAVACPGGPATRHIVNAEVLKALGPRGILVNIARGSVIDQAAMEAALADGTLGGAGLDVLDEEPAFPRALAKMDHVVLSPHIGSCTRETREAMGDLVLANVASFLASGVFIESLL